MQTAPGPARAALRGWLLAAVLGSRALVIVSACAGAALGSRVPGWTSLDHARVTDHYGSVGNVVAAPFVRWDALAYLDVARHGYTHATRYIFPLYPLLIHVVTWVVRSEVVAAASISFVAFLVAMSLLHRLTELELGRRAADVTVVLLAFAPVSLFFTAIYAESLFLALSVGALLAARQERWAIACLLAAAAAITRVTGVLLLVPLALLMWRRARSALLWSLLPVAALAAFFVYLDVRGFGLLAAVQGQVAHRFSGPFATIADGVSTAGRGVEDLLSGVAPVQPSLYGPFTLHFQGLVLIVVLALAVAALAATWRRLPAAYAAYAALVLIVVVFSETKVEPLEGLDRYALTIFPLWMGAGAWLAERCSVGRVAIATGAALVGYSYAFATWAFIA